MRDIAYVYKAESQMRLKPHRMPEYVPELNMKPERPQRLTASIAELVSKEVREIFERILARAS